MAADQQEDTVFHKIMRKELPATFVYEDDTCVAIKDLNPVAPVHYLIIPRKTIKNLAGAEPEDEPILGHLLYVASKLAKQEKLAEGYRICMKPSLKFFVLHGESKRLLKQFMRITKDIDDKQQRKELRAWIQQDFRMNKHLIDERDIKLQHVRARMALQELEASIHLSRAKDSDSKGT